MFSFDSIAIRILELLHRDDAAVGTHLSAQKLADRLCVSRSPVNEALEQLHAQGVLKRERNRGYFLAIASQSSEIMRLRATCSNAPDRVAEAYFELAEDLLRGELPQSCTEAHIKARYALTVAQTGALMARIASEGWAQRKAGYGWSFSDMLTTPDALLQSYRLRLALEPAALLEPGFRLDPAVLARCRAAELHLLAGGIETDSALQLHDRGVGFHEALVQASGNPFFIDTIERVNRVRRLLSYRSAQDRSRYRQHCEQHLAILDLIEQDRRVQASEALAAHLRSTLENMAGLQALLARPMP